MHLLAIVDLAGVWSWMSDGVPRSDFRDLGLKDREIIVWIDSDVAVNDDVRRAARDLGEWLKIKGAKPKYCLLSHDGSGKTGLDDYLAADHTIDELWALVRPDPPGAGGAQTAGHLLDHVNGYRGHRLDALDHPGLVIGADCLAVASGSDNYCGSKKHRSEDTQHSGDDV